MRRLVRAVLGRAVFHRTRQLRMSRARARAYRGSLCMWGNDCCRGLHVLQGNCKGLLPHSSKHRRCALPPVPPLSPLPPPPAYRSSPPASGIASKVQGCRGGRWALPGKMERWVSTLWLWGCKQGIQRMEKLLRERQNGMKASTRMTRKLAAMLATCSHSPMVKHSLLVLVPAIY